MSIGWHHTLPLNHIQILVSVIMLYDVAVYGSKGVCFKISALPLKHRQNWLNSALPHVQYSFGKLITFKKFHSHVYVSSYLKQTHILTHISHSPVQTWEHLWSQSALFQSKVSTVSTSNHSCKCRPCWARCKGEPKTRLRDKLQQDHQVHFMVLMEWEGDGRWQGYNQDQCCSRGNSRK